MGDDVLSCRLCGLPFRRCNLPVHFRACALRAAAAAPRAPDAAAAPRVPDAVASPQKRQRDSLSAEAAASEVAPAVLDSGERGGDDDGDSDDSGPVSDDGPGFPGASDDSPPLGVAEAAAAPSSAMLASAADGPQRRPFVLDDFVIRHYSNLRVAEVLVKGKFSVEQHELIIGLLKDPFVDPAVISNSKKARRRLADAMRRASDDDDTAFEGATRCLVPRPVGLPAKIPAEVECWTFGFENQARAILQSHPWDHFTHAEDLSAPEQPRFPGGPDVDVGCPSLSGMARAYFERDVRRLGPLPPGVRVQPLAFGLQWDGTRLGRRGGAMGYPFIMLPFFLKLPYRWRAGALRKLALLPPFFPKSSDSPSEHDALHRLFQNAVWIVLEEMQRLHERGGFYVDIEGSPTLFLPALLGFCGDGPAMTTMLNYMLHRCFICPAVRPPYHAPGAGLPWRSEADVAEARAAALLARSVAAAQRIRGAMGVLAAPSVVSRLSAHGGMWAEIACGSSVHMYPDAVLHEQLIGNYWWWIDGVLAALLEAGGAAAVGAVRRLMASNAHFSTGVKRWVSLRNIRATGKFSGFMRASQMTMLVAALRAAPLDLGDDGSLQHRLIEGGEIQMQLTAILEKELWAVGDRGRLVVLQAEGTAAFEGTLGPFGHGCQKHPNAHLQYHVPEIAVPGPTGRGAPVHWETGRNIESIQGGMHGDYGHTTGVNSDEQMIARRCDEREFVAQTLGPALDRVAAAAVAAAAGGGGAAGGSASDAGSAGSGSSEGDAAPFPPPAAAAAGRPSPYTRYPRAPPVLARLTGALWPGMLAADARCDSRLSGRMLEAFAAAYERAAAAVAGLPPLDPARCLWRRALLLSRPASLESEGCRRRLAVVPDGAAGVSHRDARRYAGQQPCVQMLVAGAGGAPPVPDVHEMRKIEALVSIDVRPQAGGARRPAALTPRTTGGNATIDFALVRVLRPQADRDSRCFLSFVNEGPSLTAGPPLLASERDLFRLVRVTSLAQPRWAFPDFGDGHPPPGERDVLPWDGRFVSVFVMPGA